MSTIYPNSENLRGDINENIQSLVIIFNFQFQTYNLYNMEYISLTKDKCLYVGI